MPMCTFKIKSKCHGPYHKLIIMKNIIFCSLHIPLDVVELTPTGSYKLGTTYNPNWRYVLKINSAFCVISEKICGQTLQTI